MFYRINVFPIEIPTLEERRDDIPELVKHILDDIKDSGGQIPNFHDSAFSALKEYLWPGNVRELRNLVERAAIIFPGKLINSNNIKENLLKVNLPNNKDESEALWNMTSNLTEVSESEDDNFSVPHPSHYKKWFDF